MFASWFLCPGSKRSKCILFALVVLAACRRFDPTVLEAGNARLSAIPPVFVILTPVFESPYHVNQEQMELTQDMRHLLLADLEKNLFHPGQVLLRKGTLEVRYAYEASVNAAWAVPSALTFTAINALGFPFASNSVLVTLQATVRDSQDRLLGAYSATEAATVYAAYYWGYFSPGPRVAHARAAKCAVESLKTQIAKDSTVLRTALAQGAPD